MELGVVELIDQDRPVMVKAHGAHLLSFHTHARGGGCPPSASVLYNELDNLNEHQSMTRAPPEMPEVP